VYLTGELLTVSPVEVCLVTTTLRIVPEATVAGNVSVNVILLSSELAAMMVAAPTDPAEADTVTVPPVSRLPVRTPVTGLLLAHVEARAGFGVKVGPVICGARSDILRSSVLLTVLVLSCAVFVSWK
jgi:hypothetical protein